MNVRAPALTLLLLATLLAGCASVRVRRADGPTVTGAWRASAVSGTDLSPRTRQTVRQYDLESLYPDRLAELAAKLHGEALRDARPSLLFALSEVNYLRGARAEGRGDAEACGFYYLSAGYAYHYLFGGGGRAAGEVFDPRFRLACDLYNAGLAKCIVAAQQAGHLDPRGRLALTPSAAAAAITLKVVHEGFRFRPEEFGPVQLCSDFQVTGLANHHRTYGLGVPLIGCRDASAPRPPHSYYPLQVSFPITAFLRFEGSLDDLHERRAGRLELLNPLAVHSVKVAGRDVPLESDLTTPLAYYLASAGLDADGYVGFLRPDSLGEKTGLHTLEPYEPGKIPVILVHGLLGSPTTWAPMFNDLQADPNLRKRFQFWVYFYPTANPYLQTAAELRTELGKMREALDPRRQDPALDDMVVVGHSMGGLISRLLTIDGGDDFWKAVSATPLDRLKLQPQTRAELLNTFYFERQPCVTRAVYLATPHRGSKIGASSVGRLGAWLAGIPDEMARIKSDVARENPDLAKTYHPEKVTSVDLLAPDAPALQLIAHRPRPAAVKYHSVVGVTSRNVLLIERLFGGGYRQPSDGVVPYSSAHLDDVESETVVDSDHYRVHHHPLAILEVRRILTEHARAHEARQRVIQPVAGAGEPTAKEPR
jgi:pimeloyl-ACP methyl ester carboxylesterase